MKQSNLPAEWASHLSTEEARETLLKWLNENYIQDYYTLKTSLGHSHFNFPNWNNHEGFKSGYHTGDSRYDIISLEDFKRLAFPVEELPEEYIVECTTDNETNQVLSKYYNKNYNITCWTYVICRNDLFNLEGHVKGQAIEDRIRDEFSTMPVFTFEEWSKLINNKKEKEMKDFKITGSLALQQAFINETGITYGTNPTSNVEKNFERFCVLTHYRDEKIFDSCIDTRSTGRVFNLPNDWNEAVAFVKEWAKKEKEEDLFVPVKAGDYVMICKGTANWSGIMDKFVGKIVKVKEANSHSTKIQEISFRGSIGYQWELKNKHYRKLSKDELKEFKTLKPLKLGDYTGSILTDDKCVYISGRGSLSFDTCIELYNKFTPYNTPEGYEIVLNSATINIGCVKDIPVEDIINAVEYMDFMGLVTL